LLGGNITKISSIANVILLLILFVNGEITVGLFIAMSGLMFRDVYQDLDAFSGFFKWSGYHINSYEFTEKFFNLSDDAKGTLTQLPDSYDIEFRDVWFRYPGTGKDVLKGLSFKIPSGQKVSIVGENGAGKTTFVKLLTRMLEPSSGEIRINGKSTRDTDAADHYNSTASVFQEPARFHTFTIADNVFLGDVEKERDEQAIDRALRFAGFDGADKHALLGKEIGGTELSGGQWQKLAIARAYYRDRDLIILDEPTSNLDPLAETEIFKKYLDMSEGKTVIMVTHRISVASLADRIVVFKDGEIVEDGTHEELMSLNGEYARLYSTQAEWYNR